MIRDLFRALRVGWREARNDFKRSRYLRRFGDDASCSF